MIKLLVNAVTPELCEDIEKIAMSYVTSLVGSSVNGEAEMDVASALMGDALTWVIQARQKAIAMMKEKEAAAVTVTEVTDPIVEPAAS